MVRKVRADRCGLELTTIACEDVADVLQNVVVKNS